MAEFNAFAVEAVILCALSIGFFVVYVLYLRRETAAVAAAHAAAHASVVAGASHQIGGFAGGGGELAVVPMGGGVGGGVMAFSATSFSNFPYWGRRLGLLLSLTSLGQGVDSQRGVGLYGAPARAVFAIASDTVLFMCGASWLLAITELLYKQLHGSLRLYPRWLRRALFAYPLFWLGSSTVLMVVCGVLDRRSIAFFDALLALLGAVQASLFVFAYVALRMELLRFVSKRMAAAKASAGGLQPLDSQYIISSMQTLGLFTAGIAGASVISIVVLTMAAARLWDLNAPYATDPPDTFSVVSSLPTYVVWIANALVCWYTSPFRVSPLPRRLAPPAAATVARPIGAATPRAGTIHVAPQEIRSARGRSGTGTFGRSPKQTQGLALVVVPGTGGGGPSSPLLSRGKVSPGGGGGGVTPPLSESAHGSNRSSPVPSPRLLDSAAPLSVPPLLPLPSPLLSPGGVFVPLAGSPTAGASNSLPAVPALVIPSHSLSPTPRSLTPLFTAPVAPANAAPTKGGAFTSVLVRDPSAL